MKKILSIILCFLSLFSLTGCFLTNTYRITFESNCDVKIETMYVQKGQNIIPTEEMMEMSKPRYYFLGWYYNGDLWIFGDDVPTSNMKLVAKWLSYDWMGTVQGSKVVDIGKTYKYTLVSEYVDEEIDIVWSVRDKTVATIDSETGELTPISSGMTTVIARIKLFGSFECRLNIEVCNPHYVEVPTENLQGYTLKIACGNPEELDPFNPNYVANDKEEKQRAWREVEEKYNCKIKVENYPVSAEYGPARWNYILSQALKNTSDYDFLYIPSNKIELFAKEKAILPLEEYYINFGDKTMTTVNLDAGSVNNILYSYTQDIPNLGFSMFYNYELFTELKKVNPSLKEPSEMYLEGNWNLEQFQKYCIEVQETMKETYGDLGDNTSEKQEYYAINTLNVYLWTGLSSNDGEPIADVFKSLYTLDSDSEIKNADLVKFLNNNNYMSAVDFSNDYAFKNNKALFTVVDLTQEVVEMDENIKYCYVPWPTDSNHKEIAVSSTNHLVMPIGRNYEGYGEDCNPEVIFKIYSEMIKQTQKYVYESNKSQDVNLELMLDKYCSSESSKKAMSDIYNLMKTDNCYYDPYNLYNSSISFMPNYYWKPSISSILKKYIMSDEKTWSELIESLKIKVYN